MWHVASPFALASQISLAARLLSPLFLHFHSSHSDPFNMASLIGIDADKDTDFS